MIDSIFRRLSGPALWAVLVMTLFFASASPYIAAAGELDEHTRVELQMTLKRFIEDNTKDGTYPFFDVDAGKTRKLRLKSLHPVIFARDDHYMMCADFLGEDGNDVLIDYIVVRAYESYAVEQQILGRRSYLKTLFERVF